MDRGSKTVLRVVYSNFDDALNECNENSERRRNARNGINITARDVAILTWEIREGEHIGKTFKQLTQRNLSFDVGDAQPYSLTAPLPNIGVLDHVSAVVVAREEHDRLTLPEGPYVYLGLWRLE